jgi:hypothetical protein
MRGNMACMQWLNPHARNPWTCMHQTVILCMCGNVTCMHTMQNHTVICIRGNVACTRWLNPMCNKSRPFMRNTPDAKSHGNMRCGNMACMRWLNRHARNSRSNASVVQTYTTVLSVVSRALYVTDEHMYPLYPMHPMQLNPIGDG